MGDKLSFLGPKAFIGRKPSRNTDVVKLNQKPIVGIHNNFTPEVVVRQPNNRE